MKTDPSPIWEENMRTITMLSIAAFLTFGSSPVRAADTHSNMSDHLMVQANDLKWADVPTLPPGAKVAVIEGPPNEAVPFIMRLKFPANYKIPAHWHPAIEHLTVLSGTFNMGIGDKLDTAKSKPLAPGGVMIIQPKVPHFAWTNEEVTVQVHGVGPWGVTYVIPADDPRKK
jgi:quercetin dioxygenase-like cupin family protein